MKNNHIKANNKNKIYSHYHIYQELTNIHHNKLPTKQPYR